MDSELKFVPCDHAETQAIARTQKRGRIFCGIEELERRAPDQIPSAGRAQRINPCLPAPDSDRTGREFFSESVPTRRGESLWQPCPEWKTGNAPDGGHSGVC